MFCPNCGSKVPDGSKFCPSCGAPLPENDTVKADENKQENLGDKLSSGIDRLGSMLGDGIDQAAKDIKKDFQKTGDEFQKDAETAQEKHRQFTEQFNAYKTNLHDTFDEGGKKNWKDYLTPENYEKLMAISPFLPLAFMIVGAVIIGFLTRLFYIPGIGKLVQLLSFLLRVLFVAASVAGAAAACVTISSNREKQSQWGYIGLAGACLACFTCIGIFFHWSRMLMWLLSLITFVLGLEEMARVVLLNRGIETEPHTEEEKAAFQEAIRKAQAAGKKEEAESERQAAEVKTEAPAVGAAAGNPGGVGIDQKLSYFDGSGFTLLGYMLLTVLVSGLTCGLAAPWMLVIVYRWRMAHTVIDGKRLEFKGTGGSLFGHYIIWEILTVITCGIYSFFMHVAMTRWMWQHTCYAGEPDTLGQFDGNSFEYFGYGLLSAILNTVTCCIATPWTIVMIQRWETRHTIVGRNRMAFDGTALGMFGMVLLQIILCIITLGIYTPWAVVRITKYVIRHTHVYQGV